MTYIRIKIKHLLVISAAVLLAAAAFVYLQGTFSYLLGKANEIAGDEGRATVFYDRAAADFPGSAGSLAGAQSKLELLFREKDFGYLRKLKLSGSSTLLDGAYINGSGIDAINRQYELISRNAARSDALGRCTILVGMANYFGGNGEKCVSLLESAGDYIKDANLEQMRRLNLAAVYMDLGEMEKGFGLIKEELSTKDRYTAIRNALYRYYCFMTGRLEDFKSMERQRDTWHMETKDLKDTLLKPLIDINNTISGYSEIAKLKDGREKTGNVFRGRVTDDGKPLAYALVYLKNAARRGGDSSLMGIGDGTEAVAVTDRDGFFRMEDVPNGMYGLGASIEWPRVQGKACLMYKSFDLKFEGGTVIEKDIGFISPDDMVKASNAGDGRLKFNVKLPEGAACYTITMGELRKVEDDVLIPNNTFYSERIESPEYTLDTAGERRRGILVGSSFSDAGIDPYDLMEPFYHAGDYAYLVTFFDSRGNIMFDSSGIFPGRQKNTVYVEGSQWSDADKLLLNKKYDEAIGKYKSLVDDPQQGLHALKIMARLYNGGWVYNAETCSLDNKDHKKALEYFRMLDERIPDSTDSIRSALALLLEESGDYEGAIRVFGRMKDANFALRQIAEVYCKTGSFTKAAEYYERFLAASGQGADNLLMLYMLLGRNGLLLDTAAKFTDNGAYYTDYVKLVREYLKFDTSAYASFFSLTGQGWPEAAARLLEGRNDDLALLYRGLLMLMKGNDDIVEREKNYRELYDKAGNDTIRQLMKYFGKAEVHSGFGDY